jgi:hypothetical protein
VRTALVILILLLLSASTSSASVQNHSKTSKSSQYIDALVSVPHFGRVYVEDGAADGSVTSPESPPQAVKNILELGPRAIPLLIAHLDDTRLTSATFEGGFTWGKPIRVPVGHVCLDILIHIIGENRYIFDWDCGDDGLGACVKHGYYFRPDEYYPVNNNEYIARDGVLMVKANWLRAQRKGLLRFRRPSGRRMKIS